MFLEMIFIFAISFDANGSEMTLNMNKTKKYCPLKLIATQSMQSSTISIIQKDIL